MAGHSHGPSPDASIVHRLDRLVVWALAPLLLLIVVGVVHFWPSGSSVESLDVPDFVSGTVVSLASCPDMPASGIETEPGTSESSSCAVATLRVDEGPDTGQVVEVNVTLGPSTPDLSPGTAVLLAPLPGDDPPYGLADVDRSRPLLALSALFAVAVVLLARWKGVFALLGLAASILVLANFVLPSLLAGNSPVGVAAVGAGAIAVVSMFLAHGFSARTGVALLGTLAALGLTTLLGEATTRAMNFTGVASDDAAYLVGVAGQSLDLRGLLLAGLVIGALGVLDDVTVTQSATVWEVFGADQRVSLHALWSAGMRVGKEHMAAVVNTLVLAYVGASLPLFLLVTLSNAPLMQSLNNELIAAEVVRSMVGGLGIVAAIPITTGLTALLLVTSRDRQRPAPTMASSS